MAVISGTDGDDDLVGTAGDDQILGLGGNDSLRGGAGIDTTEGGLGNDRHYIDDSGDVVVELAGEGDDMVLARVSYILLAGVSVEVLQTINNVQTTAIDLTGNELANSIYGNAGNNVLNGGGGIDYLVGLGGDDIYVVDNQGDVVVEAGVQGNDRVIASVSYDLADGVFVETLTTSDDAGIEAINLSGSDIGNSIFGNAGINVLSGEGGVDRLLGGAGDDVLVGGAGADVMIGGTGNDSYAVDDINEVIIELAGEGDDIVFSSVSFSLRPDLFVETLIGTGSANINLTGNELANSIYGNDGNNLLSGGSGNDYLVGLGGNDTLDGSTGSDVLRGGAGDDTYLITDSSDRAIEAGGEGTDIVRVSNSVTFVLEAGSEIETLSVFQINTTTGVTFFGNEFANVIIGGHGNDTLTGEGGADVLTGNGGDDRYYVSDSLDQIVGEQLFGGNDTVFASTSFVLTAGAYVEVISTYWQQGDELIDLTGNENGNRLIGNFGANRLDGGAGADTLVGLGGADSFAFTTVLGTVDRIVDFEAGVDRILLDDAIFSQLAPGALPPGAFATGSAATEADDRIIYNSATGALFYDADGVGGAAAVQFALLETMPVLQAGDFLVI